MKMKNPFLALASFFGATGVGLGALGAHWLRTKLEAGVINHFQYEAFDKASKYQLLHSLALLFVFLLCRDHDSRLARASGWLFAFGILFFSGSIYALSTQNICGMSFAFLGPVTPLGGLLMISGWVCLFVLSLRRLRSDR
jgi:uncharacterized membrane protein YgdD (TMEM256/DUF423 family)